MKMKLVHLASCCNASCRRCKEIVGVAGNQRQQRNNQRVVRYLVHMCANAMHDERFDEWIDGHAARKSG